MPVRTERKVKNQKERERERERSYEGYRRGLRSGTINIFICFVIKINKNIFKPKKEKKKKETMLSTSILIKGDSKTNYNLTRLANGSGQKLK